MKNKKILRPNLKGKVVLSIIILLIDILIYSKTGKLGELAQTSNIDLVLCSMSWVYLFFGQFILLIMIWED